MFFVGAELALRMLPEMLLPKGTYGAGRVDPGTGLKVHREVALYNKIRFVARTPNSDGFMDVDHRVEKDPSTYRVGFFGDSYVESLSVPLQSTFFRLLPAEIEGRQVEAFSIGVSGLGTLHSWMNYKKYGNLYDHDLVVYLFVKNDPGDHLAYFSEGDGTPYAVPAPNALGYEVVYPHGGWSDAEAEASILSRARRLLADHSLLARMLRTQLRLARIGWRTSFSEGGSSESRAPTGKVDQNELPTLWPEPVLAEAKAVTAAILEEFNEQVTRDGRDFAVLFVPRLEDEVEGLAADESWLPWLTEVCDELGIELLNPLPLLAERHKAGVTIYDDHWSFDGHRAIAEFMSRALAERLRAKHVSGLPQSPQASITEPE